MSRIHEALKKAEQERVASQGGAAQPSYSGGAVSETSTTFIDEPRGNGSGMGVIPLPTMSSHPGALDLETLLARCVPQPWVPDEKVMLFFNGEEGVRGTEEFRTLRSRLYHMREKMPLKKILVTSALPQEGKSFTSANLAQVLVRQHGRRVLLIDADLRSPKLHMMLGTTASPGLSDYLQGRADEFSIMQRGPMDSLFFIASGGEISDPSELVGSERLKLLLQRVGDLFDWIVIDSPPAVPVSDASMLAKACDGVLMVVRSNATPTDMARRARQEFPDEMLIGVVLNGAQSASVPYTRYYYDGHQKNGTESKTT